jgi:hypothetical protein
MHDHEIICEGDTVRIKGKFYTDDLVDLFNYYQKRGYEWMLPGDNIGGFVLTTKQDKS